MKKETLNKRWLYICQMVEINGYYETNESYYCEDEKGKVVSIPTK